MTIHQKLTASLVFATGAALAARPEFVALAVLAIGAIVLYGFTVYHERKEETSIEIQVAAIAKKLAEVDDKVQNISLSRSMGR